MMMWVFAVIILSVCETRSPDPVIIDPSFNLGSDANLTCSNKTWGEMLYVIWEIDLKHKSCKISRGVEGGNENSCNDGKSLHNTTRYQSYLHIPNFSKDDVGVYSCESPYGGGLDEYAIHVSITVPPSISAWLELKDNKMVAVCKAERGKPAANISWSHTENSASLETQRDFDGLFTVESRLEVPESMDTKNLSCIIRHPYWETQKILEPKHTRDLIPSCTATLMVKRRMTLKATPQQNLTVRCPVKRCGESLHVSWCKLLNTTECQRINNTKNVEITQMDNDDDELTSFLTLKWISTHDDGLYRCYIKGYKYELISHPINISVSDINHGLKNSDNSAGILTYNPTKAQEISTLKLPEFSQRNDLSTSAVHFSTAAAPTSPMTNGNKPAVAHATDTSQLYAVINHRKSGMPARKQMTSGVKNSEYATIIVS
ncbi:hypothetical protein PAMA_003123 [Pampus argenteus]